MFENACWEWLWSGGWEDWKKLWNGESWVGKKKINVWRKKGCKMELKIVS